jgi:peptidoglycan-associated lipoprotein
MDGRQQWFFPACFGATPNGPPVVENINPKEDTVQIDVGSSLRRRSLILATIAACLMVTAGCKKKAAPPPPPPPISPTAPTPTASITASPEVVNAGGSVVLSWRTTDANDVSIDGMGAVPTAGTRTVNPTESTNYHLVARGPGGTADATARVTVNAAAPTSNLAESDVTDAVFHQNVKDIFFDYDSYDIRSDAQSTISQDANFLNQHPGLKVVIGGYCDERGSTEYNLALGENRANAAKQALVTAGVSPERLRTVSYGKEKQFCTEHDESCWQLNRRAQFSLDK